MSGFETGCGVQVVSVEEDGTYRCDEAALRRVAEHAAARGLPVAVVSVAGATRGGKSFLLDFFLRYLRAPETARASDAWLGADDTPLTGFSWRGGWQRNTTGILLWSEPIIVTQKINGTTRKIAVLLMDTQGTFDNTSTVKDCTTIFAMSTLMSSVQIYNLAQIIREDDLQHLQLFTEYGKLARTKEDVKPFQALMFRVRDWMCPFEHPYGSGGGENYLKTILEADTKKQEIKDLRDHIRSSFVSVSCFLTPHPGMAVVDQNFSGRLCDLLPEFKESLLELVPSLLHPSKLVPKVINGQEITAGELPTYFRSYLEIFNSDDLPTPVNILQATSAACLETAVVAAREQYCARMECDAGDDARAVPSAWVPRDHAAAVVTARAAFAARKTLAAPALVAARLDALLKELEAKLPHYVAVNHGKLAETRCAARAAYEAAVARVRRARPLCLHPRDAPVLHAEASAAAMAVFAAGRHAPDENDDDRREMLKWLDARGQELVANNELTNAAARAAAAAAYSERTRRVARGGALGADRLQREHCEAREAALAALRAARSRASDYADEEDRYMNELIANIDEQYHHWEASNASSNRSAFRLALSTYNTRAAAVWGAHACLAPRALAHEHRAALAAALADLRTDTAEDEGSEQERQLIQACESRYEELRRTNEAGNEALVTASYAEYCRRMDVKCAPSLASVLVVPWVLKVLVQLPKYHERACAEAVDYFHSRRRDVPEACGGSEADPYVDVLKQKLSAGYDVYCHPLHALARELNIPTN